MKVFIAISNDFFYLRHCSGSAFERKLEEKDIREGRDTVSRTSPRVRISRGSIPDHGVYGGSEKVRSASEALITKFTPDPSWSNETFGENLCSFVSTMSDTAIDIPNAGRAYRIPTCFPGNATLLTSLSGYNLVIDDFSLLPANLLVLSLTSGTLTSSSGQPLSASWTEFFATASSLTNLQLTACGVGGSLPPSIPSRIILLDLSYNGLTGTIPSTLLVNVNTAGSNSFSLALAGNELTGSIPAGLFSPPGFASLNHIRLNLQANALSGSLPTELLTPVLDTLVTCYVVININQFSGSIPPNFLTSATSAPNFDYLLFDVSSNNLLSGLFPEALFGPYLNELTTFSAGMDNTGMTGTIPDTLWQNTNMAALTDYTLRLGSNSLTGSLPRSLFHPSAAYSYVSVVVSGNSLDGPIPDDFFTSVDMTRLKTFSLQASRNGISGSLPSSFVNPGTGTPQLTAVTIDLSSNAITGTFPPGLLTSLDGPSLSPDAVATPSASIPSSAPPFTVFLNLDISSNSIEGILELPSIQYPMTLQLAINNNGFTGWNVEPTVDYLQRMVMGGNFNFQGTIPTNLFSNSSALESFQAPGINFTGVMPDLGKQRPGSLNQIDFTSSSLQFCAPPRTNFSSGSLPYCQLGSTTAFYCADLYPPTCIVSAPSPSLAPVETPTSTSPINDGGTPVPIGVPSRGGTPTLTEEPTGPIGIAPPPPCPESTRPSDLFVCINGSWTSDQEIVTPTLIIPSGASIVIVNANVSSSSVVIQGLGSTLVIRGCANNLTEITVELSPEDLKNIGSKLNQSLISYEGNDPYCQDLSSVALTTKVSGSSCRKVSTTKVASKGQLSAVFSINSSGCRLWWIILVSVICAVVVIAVIAIIVVRVLCCKHKTFLQRTKSAKV